MRCISFLTDFGLEDNFAGVMKAVILKINPRVEIIDLCHMVIPYDIYEAAFLLKGSYRYFPKGTIHLVVVDPGVGSERKKIVVKTRDFYFIAPDNGVLYPALADESVQKIIEITNERYFLKPLSHTFHGRDIFAPVAGHLSAGKRIEMFGKKLNSIRQLDLPGALRKKNTLTGEVVYIDRFGNLITNIRMDEFIDFVGGSRFKVFIADVELDNISRSYRGVEKNTPLAIFGSFGSLEISVREGNARRFLSSDKGTPVRIVKKQG
jgi:S-adenosylmethionine hydrolase